MANMNYKSAMADRGLSIFFASCLKYVVTLVRGRAAEGGRGSLTHHLELESGNTPGPGLHSAEAARRGHLSSKEGKGPASKIHLLLLGRDFKPHDV